MSKRIELLEKKGEFLKRELDTFRATLGAVKDERSLEYKAVAEKYFGEVLTIEGDKINATDERIEFLRNCPERNYDKEVLTVYLRGESFRDTDVNRLETSFYSTSENSEFELNRMILLGKTAEIIIDHKDDILAEWNFVTESFSGKISDARKKVWDAEKLVSENGEKITAIENEIVKEKLFGEGIKFEMPESGRTRDLPEFDARWNYRIDKVTSIRATRKTASGKSYDVEGTFAINRWDDKKNEYYTEDSCFEIKAVKAENIDRMLFWNRELIKE